MYPFPCFEGFPYEWRLPYVYCRDLYPGNHSKLWSTTWLKRKVKIKLRIWKRHVQLTYDQYTITESNPFSSKNFTKLFKTLIIRMLSSKISLRSHYYDIFLLIFHVTFQRQRTTSKKQQTPLQRPEFKGVTNFFCKELAVFHHLVGERQTWLLRVGKHSIHIYPNI